MTESAGSPSQAAATRLAALLLGSGVLHFVVPKPYDGIVPKALPGNARTYTYASGVAELGVGAGLLIPRYRRLSAGLAALIFIAVFPANIQMAVDWWRSEKIPLPLKIGAILRLPLQIPMVTESLKARRNAA
ncbi:hypothetical protein [Antrihabitans stalactiti]|uniref:DoxX family membrane protein n=1 Tax=Antrihabitans stalactiti TaxID=2584121 RepID=A0A848KCE1_9NOCA|nr:hypothetical protein [Antrihabitans stalactiti]NMN95989.1 hypothetical protein [Antrihabitans stalactiti]